ncbi:hypothetical protein FRC12_019669 [Ceratobasidium sp. 428]|nr:hypothetical protein FRC12_019669 [Ceratobasidium sp. 428]
MTHLLQSPPSDAAANDSNLPEGKKSPIIPASRGTQYIGVYPAISYKPARIPMLRAKLAKKTEWKKAETGSRAQCYEHGVLPFISLDKLVFASRREDTEHNMLEWRRPGQLSLFDVPDALHKYMSGSRHVEMTTT